MDTFNILKFWIVYLTVKATAPHLMHRSNELSQTPKNKKWKRFDEYEEIARSSGGFILNVEKNDYKSTEFLVNTTTKQLNNYIFYIENTKDRTFEFYVDNNINEMNIVVNSFRNVDEVRITPPGLARDMNVTAKTKSLYVASVLSPIVGLWIVEVKVTNVTEVYKAFVIFSSTSYVTPDIYNMDIQPIERTEKLIPGAEYYIQAAFTPTTVGANTTIQCMDASRNSLCGINVHRFSYISKIVCPNQDFFIEIKGVMADGTKFQRWNQFKTAVLSGAISNEGNSTVGTSTVRTSSVRTSTVGTSSGSQSDVTLTIAPNLDTEGKISTPEDKFRTSTVGISTKSPTVVTQTNTPKQVSKRKISSKRVSSSRGGITFVEFVMTRYFILIWFKTLFGVYY